LRDALDLPITTQGMLYPGCSGVTDEMLALALSEIQSISDDELLRNSDVWQAWVTKKHSEDVENINKFFTNLLEIAEEYYDCDEGLREQFLANHPSLNNLLEQLPQKNLNYLELCREIDQKRKDTIAALGGNAS